MSAIKINKREKNILKLIIIITPHSEVIQGISKSSLQHHTTFFLDKNKLI